MRRKTTMKDIAREANLSVTAVSMALSGYPQISTSTRQRVLQISERLDYCPPRQRQRSAGGTVLETKGGRSPSGRRIGLVNIGPGQESPNHGRWLKALTEAVTRQDMRLDLDQLDRDQTQEESLRVLQRHAQGVDGLILMGCAKETTLQIASQLSLPFVVAGDVDTPAHALGAMAHLVTTNQLGMGQGATNLLLEQGHRRIGFFCGPYPPGGWNDHWMIGYRLAMLQAGLPDDPTLRPIFHEGPREYVGIQAAKYMASLPEPPTAYVVPTVRSAAMFRREMAQLGVEIGPGQIVMGGHIEELSAFGVSSFTLILEDYQGVARRAAHLLAQLMDDNDLPPAQIVMPYHVHNPPSSKAGSPEVCTSVQDQDQDQISVVDTAV